MNPLLVVGDLLLDRDWEGQVERVAPDAPVPVVRDPAESVRPGGAGLAALLAAREGREVTLLTAVGRGEAGTRAADELARAGVRVVDIGLDGPTPEKIRVKGGGQVLLRLDRGDEPSAVGAATDSAREAIAAAAAVLVADYGRGVGAEPGLRAALAALPASVPVVWDPHPRGAEPIDGVLVVTPNRSEARALVPEVDGDGPAAVTARARALAERWRAVNVCVTLGAEGALLVAPGGVAMPVPARRATAVDTTGAGDTFTAGLLAVWLTGDDDPAAALDAGLARAAEVVGRPGAR